MTYRLHFPPCALAIVLCTQFAAAEVTAERSKDGAVVKIDGQPFTEYLVVSGTKPVLWPILGPTGKPMTRAYPMAKVPEEKVRDHVHHRSFWFTHGRVNGVDFWGENRATIKHREFTKLESGPTAVIEAVNDWLAPDGKKVCEERRTLRFGARDDARWIDFDTTIKATEGPVTFGNTKEGSFGVRVAESMRVDSKRGGRIVNSEGQTDGGAWGRPAAWVDYHGPVDGQTVGIAILNHPTSFRFPTHWHVRSYGLFAANPFGLRDFPEGKEKDGSHTIPADQSMTLRYRVLLHRGDEKEGKIAEAFAAYSKDVK